MFAPLDEQGCERLGEGEDAGEVEGEELGPGGVGVLFVGLAPGGARVVDQYVQPPRLELGELGG